MDGEGSGSDLMGMTCSLEVVFERKRKRSSCVENDRFMVEENKSRTTVMSEMAR